MHIMTNSRIIVNDLLTLQLRNICLFTYESTQRKATTLSKTICSWKNTGGVIVICNLHRHANVRYQSEGNIYVICGDANIDLLQLEFGLAKMYMDISLMRLDHYGIRGHVSKWFSHYLSHHHHHYVAIVSHGWAKASACCFHMCLSCAILCQMVPIQ